MTEPTFDLAEAELESVVNTRWSWQSWVMMGVLGAVLGVLAAQVVFAPPPQGSRTWVYLEDDRGDGYDVDITVHWYGDIDAPYRTRVLLEATARADRAIWAPTGEHRGDHLLFARSGDARGDSRGVRVGVGTWLTSTSEGMLRMRNGGADVTLPVGDHVHPVRFLGWLTRTRLPLAIVGAGATIGLTIVARRIRQRRLRHDDCCPHCGYSLWGHPVGAAPCPECGGAIGLL